MKILYLITKSNWGGAQKYIFDLATSLHHRGSTSVVAFGDPESDNTGGGKGLLSTKLGEAQVRTIIIPHLKRDMNLLKDFLVLIQLFKIVWSEKPNVIHVNSSKLAGLGAFVGRTFSIWQNIFNKLDARSQKLEARIIFTVHGWPFYEDRPWWQRKAIYFFCWLTSFFAHKTIVITKLDYECGKKFFLLGQKMVYIPLGIRGTDFLSRDVARGELAKIAQQMGISIPVDKLWIGTIAELHKNKGYDLLLPSLKQLERLNRSSGSTAPRDKWHFVIIGEGEERKKTERTIKDLRLDNKISLLGFVSDATKYLKAFDIFTLLSRKEGLPYTLLEAGSAGLPIIASNVGGIADILENSGILVEPQDTKQIAIKLEDLISDKSKRDKFGNDVRQQIQITFSYNQMLSKTFALYAIPNSQPPQTHA